MISSIPTAQQLPISHPPPAPANAILFLKAAPLNKASPGSENSNLEAMFYGADHYNMGAMCVS